MRNAGPTSRQRSTACPATGRARPRPPPGAGRSAARKSSQGSCFPSSALRPAEPAASDQSRKTRPSRSSTSTIQMSGSYDTWRASRRSASSDAMCSSWWSRTKLRAASRSSTSLCGAGPYSVAVPSRQSTLIRIAPASAAPAPPEHRGNVRAVAAAQIGRHPEVGSKPRRHAFSSAALEHDETCSSPQTKANGPSPLRSRPREVSSEAQRERWQPAWVFARLISASVWRPRFDALDVAIARTSQRAEKTRDRIRVRMRRRCLGVRAVASARIEAGPLRSRARGD